MNVEKMLPRHWRRTRWFWPAVAFIVVVVLTALIVPLILLLHRQRSKGANGASASIILPLYIYPLDNSSWSPLYDAMKLRPDLRFTVVVNPDSGPGAGPEPDKQYIAAVTELSSYANVQLLGYIRTGYATRSVDDVIKEVNVYSGWSETSSSLAMDGIFLDETPHQYTADAVGFLRSAGQAIKNATGLHGNRTVVHNPGTVPDLRFNEAEPDITVIFEHDYNSWQEQQAAVATLPQTRSAYSVMINSVPAMDSGALKDFVDSVSETAQHIFTTTNREHFYESFSSAWLDFVSQVRA